MNQPPPAPPTPPTPPPSATPTPPEKSFFARLFDLSFNEFITPSIIKVIFIVGIVLATILSLGIFISLVSQGGGAVIAGILIAPLVFFVYVLFARVISEVYLILFRIEENTRR